MQVQRIQNNNNYNTNFGMKLVLREDMFPHKTWDIPDVEGLKKLVTTVESKTSDIKGTMYVPGVWRDWDDSRFAEHMNVYFNNGNYNDGVTLYDIDKQNLRFKTDKLIDTFVDLANVFKMRETAVRTTQKAREQIAKLQSEVDNTFGELGKKVDTKLKSFEWNSSNDVLDEEKGLEPNGKNFKDLKSFFKEDEKVQNKFLTKA